MTELLVAENFSMQVSVTTVCYLLHALPLAWVRALGNRAGNKGHHLLHRPALEVTVV